MSDEENRWKWNEFVEIGNTIHKYKGQVRIIEALRALGYAKSLMLNEFILNLPIKDQQLFKTLLPKIAEWLDGNAGVIQAAVREYFFFLHVKAGLHDYQFAISFSPKKSGIQTGFTCDVSNGTETVRYYIKTHQYGPTEDNVKSAKPPDTKELFVYKILYQIGVGPEAHFIIPTHGTKRTIYIATRDCHLILLSKLTKDTANANALLQLDLISRILCLRDCTTNSSNCGQVGERPMIVDFRIEKQSFGYSKPDILDKFYEGNSEFQYFGLMEAALKTQNSVKMDIMKKSLLEWKLLENIERAELEIDELVKRYGNMMFQNDLHQYVQDIKATVAVLMKS